MELEIRVKASGDTLSVQLLQIVVTRDISYADLE
jgi:hypothetical protein